MRRNGHPEGLAAVDPGPQVDRAALKRVCRDLLLAIGEDPDRPGLADTPRRFADLWAAFVDHDPGTIDTLFESRADQMVIVKGINVWSLCEHHLLPFRAEIAVGYVPAGKILGLSKFARIARKHASGLQVQERLTCEIADTVQRVTGSRHVAVLASGEHLCLTMRGARTPAVMVSSEMRGNFRDRPEVRAEFLGLAR